MSELTPIPPPPPQKQDPFEVVEIDEHVAASLPTGTTITSASPHGSSFWTRTARIDVELSDGRSHAYFMKVALGVTGRGMLRGEYEGVSKLYEVIPEGVPRPVAWGTYKSQPDTHFYLCDFLDMIEDLPDIHAFCLLLAKLHKESIPRSPNGKFGFHVLTYEGPMYQDTTWCDTWEESYVLRLKASLEQERMVHGPDEENEKLLPALYKKVIPRLLRPLQTKGRSIKPALIHGDIWYGNMATNGDTGEPLMFDPSVFWGHNECDLTAMGVARYRMGKHWRREYHKHFPISAPEDDYEDRMALYELRSHLCASTLYPDTPIFHDMLLREIRRLVEKYPDGYQGE